LLPTSFADSKLVRCRIAATRPWLLCPLLVLWLACNGAGEAGPDGNETATGEPQDMCIATTAHEVTAGARCDARPSAPCSGEAELEATANVALNALLGDCFLLENSVRVEFEQGCATRFTLSIEPEGSVECVAAHLAAVRYDCLGDHSCGEGTFSTLR
jgi:hypothetical protein